MADPLISDKHLGPVDPATIATPTKPQQIRDLSKEPVVPLSLCMCLDDIETAGSKIIDRRSWAYFHSAGDSLHSFRNNRDDWEKVTFRPRVLRNVARADMRQKIMGFDSNLPFFIAPAAMARLAHPDGELCNARGAARFNIPYCVSTFSSVSHEDLARCLKEEGKGGCLFFQLYVPKTRDRCVELIQTAQDLGFKALVITVDTPVVGKREEDERFKAELEYESGEPAQTATELVRTRNPNADNEAPVLRGANSSFTLNWDDLVWIRKAWGSTGPVALKGIQTAEDAKMAYDAGIECIYLSNHGGRQLDSAPSAIRTLLEIHRFCPEIIGNIEIVLDGGVRRGTDILKSIALGASSIAMGRPFMYALGAYGTEGVLKTIQSKKPMHESKMILHSNPCSNSSQ